MPLLGFGTWQLRGNSAYEAVRYALDVGYRHVDTATIYGNEDQVGRALRDSGIPRDEVFITTKIPPREAGRERKTLEASLGALGVDQIDLWLIHWPSGDSADLGLWQVLLAAAEDGLIRAAGVSNYSPAQIDELVTQTGRAPAVNQIRWSPALFDPARLAHSRDRGVVLEGYSPFRASDLSAPVLATVATAHGVTPAQVILRWHLDHGVVVIPKSAAPERIAANFDIFDFALTDQELAQIDALSSS
jgi:2,5-diketo-D-gluconate reductase A